VTLVEEVLEAIERYNLLKRKEKVILAVSGGPDSVAMLFLFLRIKEIFNLKLVCVHFNHGLRKEADEDEKFVKDLCSSLDIKFVSEKKNVKEFFKGDSLEQTARILRYDFFLKIANSLKIKKISLAHTKDDVIETVLMRIIRGTGIQGLRGILPLSKIKGKIFIRPLIEIEKKRILDWLKKEKISYQIDTTNFEDKFFRNKIRLNVLPLLEKLNPNIKDTLFNLARISSWNHNFITQIAQKELSKIKRGEGENFLIIDLEKIKDLHPFLLLQVLRLAIEEVKGNTRRLDWRHFESILKILQKKRSYLNLPGLIIEIREKKLILKSLQGVNFRYL